MTLIFGAFFHVCAGILNGTSTRAEVGLFEGSALRTATLLYYP